MSELPFLQRGFDSLLDYERGRGVDSEHDALRAHIRMRLAFWQAQDRRSITSGPSWLWRGQYTGPLRQADLSAPTGEVIAQRRRAGIPGAALFATAGPRRYRLPRWASPRSATYWATASLTLALVALICSRATDDQAGLGALAGWSAAACAIAALSVAGMATWAHRDPLRLSTAQVREVRAARRVLEWNPLAGAGPITAGGAHLLEGLAVIADLEASSAWTLPGVDLLRWRFDPDEETFQIARAAYHLDLHETESAAQAQRAPLESSAGAVAGATRRQLTDALLDRLLALHRCVAALGEVQRRAQQASTAHDESATGDFFGAAAENELAADALSELNTDLLVVAEAYDDVDPSRRSR